MSSDNHRSTSAETIRALRAELAEARAQIAAKDAALKWDRKRACKAAEVASLRFQQWIPQQWMDLFMEAYEAGDER